MNVEHTIKFLRFLQHFSSDIRESKMELLGATKFRFYLQILLKVLVISSSSNNRH